MKKQMTIRIEDGKTIISTGVKSGDPKNKTGVKGLTYNKQCGTYTLSIVSKGKKYHIGNYATIEEGKAMRKKADSYIADGTFDQWVQQFIDKRVVNKLGVKGLSRKGNVYQLVISVKQKKYFLGSFATPEAAKHVREEAEKHIKNGTFDEWYKTIKPKKHSNNNGIKGVFKNPNGTYQLSISYLGKKHFLGIFKSLDDARIIRKEAEKQIEAGTFEEWIAELKESRKNKNQ